MPLESTLVRRAADALSRARRVLAITGAGISVDSGLPTYRGIAGLYAGGLTDEGIPYEEALSGGMLRRNPVVAWRQMGRLEAACRGAVPNRGHEVLALLQSASRQVTVLTQNVDGLHIDAGSTDVIEIHGAIRRLRCDGCGWRCEPVDWDRISVPPSCPTCGADARPDVVLFGESLPDAAVRRMADAVARGPDVVLSIGTTSTFPYIAWPVIEGRGRGAMTIEINPDRTDVSDIAEVRLSGGAAQTLDTLWAALQGGESGTP